MSWLDGLELQKTVGVNNVATDLNPFPNKDLHRILLGPSIFHRKNEAEWSLENPIEMEVDPFAIWRARHGGDTPRDGNHSPHTGSERRDIR